MHLPAKYELYRYYICYEYDDDYRCEVVNKSHEIQLGLRGDHDVRRIANKCSRASNVRCEGFRYEKRHHIQLKGLTDEKCNRSNQEYSRHIVQKCRYDCSDNG